MSPPSRPGGVHSHEPSVTLTIETVKDPEGPGDIARALDLVCRVADSRGPELPTSACQEEGSDTPNGPRRTR
jgi:hypothetical protein